MDVLGAPACMLAQPRVSIVAKANRLVDTSFMTCLFKFKVVEDLLNNYSVRNPDQTPMPSNHL
jgi:hypothetical protein